MKATIHNGDAMQVLPTLPAGSAHCVVTSPPYFGLRSYLPKGHKDKASEIGLERSLEEYLAKLVALFAEVRRVLRDDGTCWLNMGDSYFGDSPTRSKSSEAFSETWDASQTASRGGERRSAARQGVFTAGNLMNVPWRLAEALRADGWCVRDEIIWRKPAAMPESVAGWTWQQHRIKVKAQGSPRQGHTTASTSRGPSRDKGVNGEWLGGPEYVDCPGCPKCEPNGGLVLRKGSWRTTRAHEKIFLLTKGMGYFADAIAASEPAESATLEREKYTRIVAEGKSGDGEQSAVRHDHESISGGRRNPRSVWTIGAEPSALAHYAAYPTELVRKLLEASAPVNGVCGECGAPWARIVSTRRSFESGSGGDGEME